MQGIVNKDILINCYITYSSLSSLSVGQAKESQWG